MSALLDALRYFGEAVDKPGRAVRGVLGGRPDEALAFMPFSDSMGLTDRRNAISGADLVGFDDSTTSGMLGGMAVDLALDPTTYFGGAILGKLAGKAGAAMDTAAAMRGPGYSTSVDDLTKMLDKSNVGDGGRSLLSDLLSANPKVASEIHPGSSFLGHGDEAIAFRSPGGDVVRLGVDGVGAPGRPISESVLQTTRTADYPMIGGRTPGGNFTVRTERTPFADRVADADYWNAGKPSSIDPKALDFRSQMSTLGRADTPLTDLTQRAKSEGILFSDNHIGNVGVHAGQPKIIDPGAYETGRFAGGFQSVAQAGDVSPLMRRLLDITGGQRAMRRAVESGKATPGYEPSFGMYGRVAGAGLGGFGTGYQPGAY